ncbi:MAG: alpha/beta fold hydrolase [Phycisphaerae bacterium]|nr:alpha/beta fold hydrolase [Phycisphaerae bacterium]
MTRTTLRANMTEKGWRRLITRWIMVALLAYSGWLAVVYLGQRWILFPRGIVNGRVVSPPSHVDVWHEQRPDGITADAWFVASRAAGAADGRSPAIVLLHGNAMLASDWMDWADSLAQRGVHVLIPEFRGYGRSAGTPSRDALVGDIAAFLNRLRDDPRVDGRSIILYGRSIGGAIAAEASVRTATPPAALVLHTTPARLRDLSWRFGAPPFLVRDAFDTESAVIALRDRVQIAIIGHSHDEIVPFADSERLASLAGVEIVTIAGSHNQFDDASGEEAFEQTIERVLRAPLRAPDERRR